MSFTRHGRRKPRAPLIAALAVPAIGLLFPPAGFSSADTRPSPSSPTVTRYDERLDGPDKAASHSRVQDKPYIYVGVDRAPLRGSSYTHQWNRNGTLIPSVVNETYVPTEADTFTHITVTVTANPYGYNPASATSNAVWATA